MSDKMDSRSKVAKKVWERIACIYHRLPKLVYVPIIWSEEDRTIWRDMSQTGTFSISPASDFLCNREAAARQIVLHTYEIIRAERP